MCGGFRKGVPVHMVKILNVPTTVKELTKSVLEHF